MPISFFTTALQQPVWAVILTRTITIVSTHGPAAVPEGVAALTQWTQTAACLEILHSLLGAAPEPTVPLKTTR